MESIDVYFPGSVSFSIIVCVGHLSLRLGKPFVTALLTSLVNSMVSGITLQDY